ncbi:transmembrane protein 201 homolog [Leptopilina heterotoma]|uniref:transmembrane protein 201 homolog n=1 Tax=Leptopilina heterotoma TaxID=63436 RepID=UPI001CA9DEDB|nr:transmembrane protein 201 homolog [Leptopilina heterotoma]
MDFHQELLINFAPILLTLCFTIVTLLTVFYKLKVRQPIKANCWFCNCNVCIWKDEENWWLCPFCSQYNGFSKDGDYKYPIPEQREIPHTPRFYTVRNASEADYKNYLCTLCNSNEEIKLLEFRKFEKTNSRRTENEIQDFKQTIEEKYPLCFKCKQIVNQVLQKQSVWLTRYKMMIFKQKPVKLFLHNRYKIEKISRILLIIIVITIVYNHTLWQLSTVGILLQLGISLMESKYDKQEIFLIILWISISILSTFNEYIAKTDSIIFSISLNCILRHCIIVLGSIIGFMNVKTTKSFRMSRKKLTFKKLDTSSNNSESDCTSSPEHSFLTSFSSPSRKALKVSNSSDTALRTNSLKLVKNNPSHFNEFSNSNCNGMKSLEFSDSIHNLSTLSLNQGYQEKLGKTSNIFETKTYSSPNSALFSKYNAVSKNSKKSILTPSRLKSTATSWMGDGYWQDGVDPSSLSRSSSQSSSRETPVYNDFDQCSIVSGNVHCCCSSHKLSQVSLNGNCRFNSSFNRPATITCNQLTDFTHNQTLFNNSSPFIHLQGSNSAVHDQCMKPIYTGHTTVITSPFWLPLFLCYCTLIINIIILCVVLLR